MNGWSHTQNMHFKLLLWTADFKTLPLRKFNQYALCSDLDYLAPDLSTWSEMFAFYGNTRRRKTKLFNRIFLRLCSRMLQVNSQVNFFQVFKLNIFSLDVNWASNIRSIYILCPAGYEFHNYVPSYVSAFLKINEMEYWKVSRESETLLENRLTHFSPMFYFYTPENVRKSNVFWHLHKGQKWNIDKKTLLSLKGVFHSSRARNWREYIFSTT